MISKLLKFMFVTIVLLTPSAALATDASLPVVLHGTASITNINGGLNTNYQYYSAGFGNYALLNIDGSLDIGFDGEKRLASGSDIGAEFDSISFNPYLFFMRRTSSGANDKRLMISQTYITAGGKSYLVNELPVVYTGNTNIVGNTYGSAEDYNNFAYWGRSLAQVRGGNPSGDSGETWGVGSYTIDSKSYAYWDGDSVGGIADKLNIMAGEGKVIASRSLDGSNWYLQNEPISNSSDQDSVLYPDGKTWFIDGNLTISGNNNYEGKGTIFIDGNLTISNGASIESSDDKSALGFVVFGDIKLEGNNTVDAAMISIKTDSIGGTIKIEGNNIKVNGFCVANSFNWGNHKNLSFLYNHKLDQYQSPGFRNLQFVRPGETGNK